MDEAAIKSLGESAPSSALTSLSPRASRYRFRLANREDDPQIRQLLSETPMKGPVSVTLRCEPSYFQMLGSEDHHQTLLAIDASNDRIVGMGSRNIQLRYVDQTPTNVGYLSSLRILESHRGGTLLARGYRAMRQLHEDGAADFYLTTIVSGNEPAFNALTIGRRSLPTYYKLGEYHTFVLPVGSHRATESADLHIRPLAEDEVSAAVDFLRLQRRSKQFFPCYQENDLLPTSSTFAGMRVADILSAWSDGELVGLLGLWNQSKFKQCVIEGYSPWLRLIRPAFNGVARCLGWPTFPGIGQQLPTTMAAFPLVNEDNKEIFSLLLQAARQQVRIQHPESRSLLIGAFQHDPMFELLGRACLHRFVSQVFLVYWDEAVVRPERFLGRNLYLELGCL